MVKQDTRRDINPALLEIEDKVRGFHEAIVTADSDTASAAGTPTLESYGSVLVLEFTPNTDDAFRQFKIPHSFVGNAAIHLHWTKSSDADELGKAVRWRVEYTIFNGSSQDINVTPSFVEIEDTYDVSDTTARVVYRTSSVPLTGFVAGYYLGLRVLAVTPVGVALSGDPSLFSVDLTFNQYINNGL